MVGGSGVLLPNFLQSKLSYLEKYDVGFNSWLGSIEGNMYTPFWIIGGFILVLVFRNCIQRIEAFKPSRINSFFGATVLAVGILSLTQISEFLYFNF
jgi:hypothetical protein